MSTMSRDVPRSNRSIDTHYYIAEYISLRNSVTCSICLDLFTNPVGLLCNHSFCKDCITRALDCKKFCPICNGKVSNGDLRSFEGIDSTLSLFRKLLEKMDERIQSRRKPTVNLNPYNEVSVTMQRKEQVSHNQAASLVPDARNSDNNHNHHVEDIDDDETVAPYQENEDETHIGHAQVTVVVPDQPATAINPQQPSNPSNPPTAPEVAPPLAPSMTSIFKNGTLVNVLPRTWIGINKLGGVGWIVDHHQGLTVADEGGSSGSGNSSLMEGGDDIYYKIRYVLDHRVEDDIPSVFVETFQELTRERRRGTAVVVSKPAAGSSSNSHGSQTNKKRKIDNLSSNSSNNNSSSIVPLATNQPRQALAAVTANNNNNKKMKVYGTNHQPPSHNKDQDHSCTGSSSSSSSKENYENLASSSSTSVATTNPQAKMVKTRNIVLLTTCIDDSTIERKIEEMVLAFTSSSSSSSASALSSISLAHHFSNKVTHLIVSVDKQGQKMKQRTMKYMQALAHGLWILSSQWIVDSLQQGQVIDEAGYEVKSNLKAIIPCAPQRARLAAANEQKKSLLLHDYHILFHGSFPLPGPPRSDLEGIVQATGGMVYTNSQTFLQAVEGFTQNHSKQKGNKKCLIVRSTLAPEDNTEEEKEDEEQEKEEDSYFDTTYPGAISKKVVLPKHLPQVTALWIMDTITNYQVQDYTTYLSVSSSK